MVWPKCKEAQAGLDTASASGGTVGSYQDDKGEGRPKMRRMLTALTLCFMFLAMSGVTPALAGSGSPTAGSVIDSSLVGELVELVKQVAGLFSVFPINVFLIGSLAGLGFSLFRKAKRTAVE